MKIIDKNKDFYDSLSYMYGNDDFPTYDRRGSIILNKVFEKIYEEKEGFMDWMNFHVNKCENNYLLMQFGFYNVVFEVNKKGTITFVKEWDSLIHSYSKPVAMERFTGNYSTFLLLTLKKDPKIKADEIKKIIEKGLDKGFRDQNNEHYHENFPDQSKIILDPIIKDSLLKPFLDAKKVYKGIDIYLRSLYNDKSMESEGLKDIDKVVNHGFDKKTSFRKEKES